MIDYGVIEHAPCPYCGARFTGIYGWPHICKELIYCSMPILRFEEFEVRSVSPAEKREHQVRCVNAALPAGFPPLPDEVSQHTLSEVSEILAGP